MANGGSTKDTDGYPDVQLTHHRWHEHTCHPPNIVD